MRVDFYDSNFNLIELKPWNVKTIDFEVDSLAPSHAREGADGFNGTNTLGTTLEGREMRVKFLIDAVDVHDFYLVRSQVYKWFTGLDFLYIVDRREPGKRWSKVKVNSKYSMERINPTAAQFTIEFMSDNAYCESIGDTTTPFTYDADVWQYGQGLPDDVDDIGITYDTRLRDFSIYNAGDVEIDPRELPLTILVTAAQTSSNTTMSITNYTNGKSWTYTGPTVAGQVFKLENVKCELGGSTVSLNTNYGLLNIMPGWNTFGRNNAISNVKFIFHFYYYS